MADLDDGVRTAEDYGGVEEGKNEDGDGDDEVEETGTISNPTGARKTKKSTQAGKWKGKTSLTYLENAKRLYRSRPGTSFDFTTKLPSECFKDEVFSALLALSTVTVHDTAIDVIALVLRPGNTPPNKTAPLAAYLALRADVIEALADAIPVSGDLPEGVAVFELPKGAEKIPISINVIREGFPGGKKTSMVIDSLCGSATIPSDVPKEDWVVVWPHHYNQQFTCVCLGELLDPTEDISTDADTGAPSTPWKEKAICLAIEFMDTVNLHINTALSQTLGLEKEPAGVASGGPSSQTQPAVTFADWSRFTNGYIMTAASTAAIKIEGCSTTALISKTVLGDKPGLPVWTTAVARAMLEAWMSTGLYFREEWLADLDVKMLQITNAHKTIKHQMYVDIKRLSFVTDAAFVSAQDRSHKDKGDGAEETKGDDADSKQMVYAMCAVRKPDESPADVAKQLPWAPVFMRGLYDWCSYRLEKVTVVGVQESSLTVVINDSKEGEEEGAEEGEGEDGQGGDMGTALHVPDAPLDFSFMETSDAAKSHDPHTADVDAYMLHLKALLGALKTIVGMPVE